MTDIDTRPTKVRGIIRANLDRIEELQKAGYTRAAIIKLLENENELTISPTSFKSALYVARKDRQEGKIPTAPPRPITPPTGPIVAPINDIPTIQPERASEPHEDPEPEPPAPPNVTEEWQPKKAINPHLLALKNRKS